MDHDEPVTVYTVKDARLAEVVRIALEGEGIKSNRRHEKVSVLQGLHGHESCARIGVDDDQIVFFFCLVDEVLEALGRSQSSGGCGGRVEFECVK